MAEKLVNEQKQKHKEYILTKVMCPCGTETARCNLSHHRKTKKHIKWEKSNDRIIDELLEQTRTLTESLEDIQLRLKRVSKKLNVVLKEN